MSNKLTREVRSELLINKIIDQEIKDWLEWDSYEPIYLTKEEAWDIFRIEYNSK